MIECDRPDRVGDNLTVDCASCREAEVDGGAHARDCPARRVAERQWWARLLLGIVAVAQLAPALGALLGTDLLDNRSVLSLVLGVGLGWVALYPRAAGVLTPVLAGVVLVLLGYVVVDLVSGAAQWSRVLGHVQLVVGLVLVVAVGVLDRRHSRLVQ